MLLMSRQTFHFNFKEDIFIFYIDRKNNKCNISVLNAHCFHFEYKSKKNAYN